MKHLTKFIIVFFLSGQYTTLQSQSTISASGGNASGTGGTASYTIGQVSYTKNTGANGSVSQGVQQPYEISVLTETEQAKVISIESAVYPNPASDILKLKIENNEIENLSFQLYDINGTLLLNNKVERTITDIIMSNYVPAVYFLKIIQGNKEIKTFKIIKN